MSNFHKYFRAGSRKFRKPHCCRRRKSAESIQGIELASQLSSKGEESLTQNVEAIPTSANESKEETTLEEGKEEVKEESCCCSVFKRKVSTIASCIKSFLVAISVVALVKSVLSLVIFLYDVCSKYYTSINRSKKCIRNIIKVPKYNLLLFVVRRYHSWKRAT